MNNISLADFESFKRRFNSGTYPGGEHLRFGQAFCNEFEIHDPEIFYEQNPVTAEKKILTKHVDWN